MDANAPREVRAGPAARPRAASLRIALVAPAPGVPGGQAVQAGALAEALQADGHRVKLVPIEPRPPVLLRPIRRRRYARTILNQALYLPSLARLAGVDVAHVFAASHWAFLLAAAPAMTAARAAGARTILHYHSGDADDHLRAWGIGLHPFLRLAHRIVVPSEFLARAFRLHGYEVSVIPNVVDAARFRFRERRPLRPRLLCARSLAPGYGVDTVIEAFDIVRARIPDASLTIAGDGPDAARMRERAPGARFLGAVPPSLMPSLHDGCDIFVNASTVDNQPVSVLEAFASGLPVVSTAAGDLAAMVRDRETGLRVPAADAPALARAVLSLVERPDAARGMARRARVLSEAHGWPRVRAQWLDVYGGGAA